jgi:ribosomal protein S18 acetylase RimI-like enzyme
MMKDSSLGCLWLIQAPRPIGYIVLTLGYSLEFQGRDAFIDEFYIRSSFRGQGYGSRVMALVEKEARSLGVHALHLEVERGNLVAQAFYRKAGYKDHSRYLMTKWIQQG